MLRFTVLFVACGAGLLAGALACAREGATAAARTSSPPSDAGDGAGVSASDGAADTVAAPRGRHIALLYSSNLQGEYEHCGCPSHPLGGLVRRATVVDRARAEADAVLVVDAGDMLLPARFHAEGGAPPEPVEVERRARLILTSYKRMGLAAFLPAERDLAIGPARLERLLAALRVPATAANLSDAGGRLLFARDLLLPVDGVAVGIFGVVAPQTEDEALWRQWGIRADDPVAAARAEVASLAARGAQMIVALLHLGTAAAGRKLLEEVPGITWAVQGHAGNQLETPDTVGGARVVEAMSLGRLAGRLDIHVVEGAGPAAPPSTGTDGGVAVASYGFTDRGERAQVLTIVADHRRQLADLERRATEDKTDQLRDYYKLRRDGLTAAIARETELARKLPRTLSGSWFENRIIPLDDSIPDHPAIVPLVAAYNRENARRAAAGHPVGIALRDAPGKAPVGHASPTATKTAPASLASPTSPATASAGLRYAGTAACARCHASAYRVFQATKHAHALAVLAHDKRDRDPTCVGCHSTGYFLPGGTTDIHVATRLLKDVGCESCHGPSLEHASHPDKPGATRRRVDELTCRGCHTVDQTNGEFDYQSFRKAILAEGHGAAP